MTEQIILMLITLAMLIVVLVLRHKVLKQHEKNRRFYRDFYEGRENHKD